MGNKKTKKEVYAEFGMTEEDAKRKADEIIKQRLEELSKPGVVVDEQGKIVRKNVVEDEIVDAVDVEGSNDDGFSSLKSFSTKTKKEDQEKNQNLDQKDEDGEEKVKESFSAYSDRNIYENTVVDDKENIEKKMEELGLSKDEVVDLIFQLTDYGYIEDSISLFNGKLTATFRSPKMADSAKFIDVMDEEKMNTPAKVEFYVNLYSLAGVLIRYRNEDLSEMPIDDRANWIESNIPTVLYKILLSKSQDFLQKIELLSSEEVANFF